MTTSESTLRTLAGLSQGRNVRPAFTLGFGPPAALDASFVEVDQGVDLQNTTHSIVQLRSGFRSTYGSSGARTDYVTIASGTVGAPGTKYTVEIAGTNFEYIAQSGDTPFDVLSGLRDLIGASMPAGRSPVDLDILTGYGDAIASEYHLLRVGALAGLSKPTVVIGPDLLVLSEPVTGPTTMRIWLRQTLADGSVVWSVPSGGDIEVDVGQKWVERISTAGFDRIFVQQIFGPSGLVEAWAAPCTPEVG